MWLADHGLISINDFKRVILILRCIVVKCIVSVSECNLDCDNFYTKFAPRDNFFEIGWHHRFAFNSEWDLASGKKDPGSCTLKTEAKVVLCCKIVGCASHAPLFPPLHSESPERK